MNRYTIALIVGLLAASGSNIANAETPPVQEPRADAATEPALAATYDVYIDGPTGYAFIKTPKGWKFIRNIKEELASRPKSSEMQASR